MKRGKRSLFISPAPSLSRHLGASPLTSRYSMQCHACHIPIHQEQGNGHWIGPGDWILLMRPKQLLTMHRNTMTIHIPQA
jgi:hypothetical protein